MPYNSINDINPSLKGIDPPISLEQANLIASWADAMEASGVDGSPWAIAISRFKNLYRRTDSGWIEESTELTNGLLQESRAPFPHAGGKTLVIKHIMPLLPKHSVYVEPFSGSASVYFSLDNPAPRIILADIDTDLINALNFVKTMTPEDASWLISQNWTGSPARHKFLRSLAPVRRRDAMYRFLYLNTFSWAGQPIKGYAHGHVTPIKTRLEAIQKAQEHIKRSQSVDIIVQSADKTVAAYDSPETFFYIDPPYPGSGDDEAFNNNIPTVPDLVNLVNSIKKGTWMMSLFDNEEVRKAFAQYNIKGIEVRRRYSNLRRSSDANTPAASTYRKELIIYNYPAPAGAATEDAVEEPEDEPTEVQKSAETPPQEQQAPQAPPQEAPEGPPPVAPAEESVYLYGPVLIPDTPDAHNQTITPEEILTAVREMPKDITVDIEHSEQLEQGAVRITQSFVLPVDAVINGTEFKKNTAIVEMEVLDKNVITRIKNKELSGFSIYGTAMQDANKIRSVTIDRISLVKHPAIRADFTVTEHK